MGDGTILSRYPWGQPQVTVPANGLPGETSESMPDDPFSQALASANGDQDSAVTNALYLKRIGLTQGDVNQSAPSALNALQAAANQRTRQASETHADKLSDQYNEILNESQAGADAAQGPGAMKAAALLKQAVASKLGLNNAEDESQLTQAHEQVLTNAAARAAAAAQPKYDAQAAHDAVTAQIAARKNQLDSDLATKKISAQEYAAEVGALGHLASTPFGANASMIPPPTPLTGLNAAVGQRTGGDTSGRTFSAGQEGLIAKYLTQYPQESRADAISFYDRNKASVPGWQ